MLYHLESAFIDIHQNKLLYKLCNISVMAATALIIIDTAVGRIVKTEKAKKNRKKRAQIEKNRRFKRMIDHEGGKCEVGGGRSCSCV